MADYFTRQRATILGIINKTIGTINDLSKPNFRGNRTRSKKEIISNVEKVKGLLNAVDVKFKTDFMRLYNVAKKMEIEVRSGSENANNPSKLIYHWTRVQSGGKRFTNTHRLPKVSEMNDILKQLADRIEATKTTKESVERAAKMEKNAKKRANATETEKQELLSLKSELNKSKNRLGNTNTRRSTVQGTELASPMQALTQEQRNSIKNRFKANTSGEIVVNTKGLGITNATKNTVLSGNATNSQLRSIARAMKYNIYGNTTVST